MASQLPGLLDPWLARFAAAIVDDDFVTESADSALRVVHRGIPTFILVTPARVEIRYVLATTWRRGTTLLVRAGELHWDALLTPDGLSLELIVPATLIEAGSPEQQRLDNWLALRGFQPEADQPGVVARDARSGDIARTWIHRVWSVHAPDPKIAADLARAAARKLHPADDEIDDPIR